MLVSAPVSWPFDPSAPHVTPAQNAEYLRQRLGLEEWEWALPATLVATFQRESWRRLVARCDLAPPGERGADLMPLSGRAGGVPVAAVRMTIGAPAAALTMETAIARGVRNVLVVGSAGSLRDDLPVGSALLVAVSDELGQPEWRPGFHDERYVTTLVAAADAVVDCAVHLG